MSEEQSNMPLWIKQLGGCCVCFNDISSIKESCSDNFGCWNQSLRDILKMSEKPTKITLLTALLKTGRYNFQDLCAIIRATYGTTTTEAVTQRIYDTIVVMKRKGYAVSKDSEGYYITRRKYGSTATKQKQQKSGVYS